MLGQNPNSRGSRGMIKFGVRHRGFIVTFAIGEIEGDLIRACVGPKPQYVRQRVLWWMVGCMNSSYIQHKRFPRTVADVGGWLKCNGHFARIGLT